MACQCENDRAGCLCVVTPGLNVGITGGGTAADPIIISVANEYLVGVSGTGTVVTVTGAGDVDDPYLLRVELSPLLSQGWDRWYGSRAQLVAAGPIPIDTLAVVNPSA